VISTQPLLIALLASVIGAERVTVPTIYLRHRFLHQPLYLFSGDAKSQPRQHDHRRPADFHERRVLGRLCDL
jgi:hypothetical protein